jgi:hypothetical protein
MMTIVCLIRAESTKYFNSQMVDFPKVRRVLSCLKTGRFMMIDTACTDSITNGSHSSSGIDNVAFPIVAGRVNSGVARLLREM